jgi:arsenate reductase (glutaredoxin)
MSKKLDSSEQGSAGKALSAISLMLAYPSAIKRPIIETGLDFLIGFDDVIYQSKLL